MYLCIFKNRCFVWKILKYRSSICNFTLAYLTYTPFIYSHMPLKNLNVVSILWFVFYWCVIHLLLSHRTDLFITATKIFYVHSRTLASMLLIFTTYIINNARFKFTIPLFTKFMDTKNNFNVTIFAHENVNKVAFSTKSTKKFWMIFVRIHLIFQSK